jgi:LuxR family maltose regulon positive regulatory protein
VLWYAHCATLLGDSTAARHLDRQMALLEQPALALYRQQNGTFFVAVQSLIDWTQGRYDAARTRAAGAEAWANHHEWPVVGRVRRLLRILVLLADRDWMAAARELEGTYAQQRQSRESVPFGDAGLLLAHAYRQLGREADALAILDDALALHEQHGTPGLVLLLGAPVVVPLLRLAVVHHLHAPFAAQTLGMFPHQPEPHPQPTVAHITHADPDTLSARELEVLRLIAVGASNREIAERLIISVATVKKHINNIFAKLHVQSRTQALVRARERGLV